MTGMRCASSPLCRSAAKQFAAAENSYRTLLARFPNDAELHDGLGSVLLAQLKYRGSAK